MLRVVPDGGVPEAWLSGQERERLAWLTSLDPDDVPSVRLALGLRAVFVSKDKRALRAAYGDTAGRAAAQREWLELLQAGGDYGQARRMLYGAGLGGGVVA